MSPAPKRKTIAAAGDNGGEVIIEPTSDGSSVTITWLCGDEAIFTQKDLIERFERAQLFADRWNGVWLQDTDSQGRRYAVMIENRRFYADRRPRENPQHHVSWTRLKRAMVSTIAQSQRELAKTQPKEGTEVST